jgi:hypothetical protein
MDDLNENELNDSYILKEDKLNLIRTIKKIYNEKFSWADDVLMRCLVKNHYRQVIENMNEEDYKRDITNTDIDYLVSENI